MDRNSLKIGLGGAAVVGVAFGMARYAYDRLTALDNSFLILEKPTAYMHVASTQIFEVGPLRTLDGGIDAEAIKKMIAASLHLSASTVKQEVQHVMRTMRSSDRHTAAERVRLLGLM